MPDSNLPFFRKSGDTCGGVRVEVGLECDGFGKHEGEESIMSKDVEVGML